MTKWDRWNCKPGQHCKLCRDVSATGAAWRQHVGAPEVCPHGVPWNGSKTIVVPNNTQIRAVNASRGLGDTVAKLTSKLGIPPCRGCKKRRAVLNRLVPYRG